MFSKSDRPASAQAGVTARNGAPLGLLRRLAGFLRDIDLGLFSEVLAILAAGSVLWVARGVRTLYLEFTGGAGASASLQEGPLAFPGPLATRFAGHGMTE